MPYDHWETMKILRLTCGLAFLLGGFAMTAGGGLIGVIAALAFALLGASMLCPFIVAPVINFFSNFFYSDSGQPAPEEYSLVHKLLQENQPDEAAVEAAAGELSGRCERCPPAMKLQLFPQ